MMSDLAWTANTLLVQSGDVVVRRCTETINEGDWVYDVSAGTTIGQASNATAAKSVVSGQALRSGVNGSDVTVALPGAVINATATPSVAKCSWYVLGAAGVTSTVDEQASTDYASLVARGTAAGQYKIEVVNTGLQVP